jgi:glycerol-3-phosphate dehydrogenase
MDVLETQVLIIGGGATGTALARDLSLRGVACVLAERDDLNAGASGRNYVAHDPDAARECRAEGAILKRVAPQCIQETGGYFVAVAGDDEGYVADFPGLCERCGIAVRAVPVAEARAREPALTPDAIAVYEVPDASIDPFRLSLESMAQAQGLGARLLRRTGVVALEVDGDRVTGARLRHGRTGAETRVVAEVVVNAAGAWARQVAALAGIDLPLLYSKGTLLVTHARLAHRVVNRLRRPSDADIVMPGGTVSIVGTTSITVPDLETIRPTVPEVDLIVEEAAAMLPALRETRYIRAYAGVRPLAAARATADGRAVSRGFALIDHARDGRARLVTITGGKLTTCRLMAERTADLVGELLGVAAPCRTGTEALPTDADSAWTEPGLAPRAWMGRHAAADVLLCECEMVSRSALDAIARDLPANGGSVLADLALRSRLGKGACQGTFCAVRAVAHLYDQGRLTGDRGAAERIEFFRERWRGQHAILWGEQLAQAELAEAIHCGLHGDEAAARAAAAPPPDPEP